LEGVYLLLKVKLPEGIPDVPKCFLIDSTVGGLLFQSSSSLLDCQTAGMPASSGHQFVLPNYSVSTHSLFNQVRADDLEILLWIRHPMTVRKCGPQSDHVEMSDLAKRFFIAGWERERAESQEREGERGRGLSTPQWDLA
jgi:hypothetical protein